MRALPLLLLLASSGVAQDAARPRYNTSFVPDDDEPTRNLVLAARRAAEAGSWAEAADRLQTLLLGGSRGVVSLQGRQVYVSPRRWAQIQLLSGRPPFGAEVLAAWRDAHDAEANGALGGAMAGGDEREILDLLDRTPAATRAPWALLGLFDRALQRGALDAARGYLLRVPEHLSLDEEERFSASAALLERRAFLEGLGERPVAGWPTPGGAAHRGRAGDAVPGPGEMTLLWEALVLDETPAAYEQLNAVGQREHSPLLPFEPVLDDRHVYVHLGDKVAVLDRASGKLLFYAPSDSEGSADRVGVMLLDSPGPRAPTVHEGVLYFERVLFDEYRMSMLPSNELVAFDVERRQTLWTLRPSPDAHDLPEPLRRPVFFRGAPAVEGDRLYVYGAVRAEDEGRATRREIAHLFCLDRSTGALLWERFLGYGEADAPPSRPPLSGSSPALAGGVVVAVTGIGVAAALDARTGEILWLFRYDRHPVRERERLSEDTEEKVHLGSAWFREPPLIVGDRVLFAPFDADELYACWLRGERRGANGFFVEQWAKHRSRGHRHSLLETVAGVASGRVLCCGRRDERQAAASFQAIVGLSLRSELDLAYATIPSTERAPVSGAPLPPERFGRPAIAGGVLLLPTERTLYRFDLTGGAGARVDGDGEAIREFAPLPSWSPPAAPAEAGLEEEPPAPAFGTLVAADGQLFAATLDRIRCYGRKG